jgi:hypothetical protein
MTKRKNNTTILRVVVVPLSYLYRDDTKNKKEYTTHTLVISNTKATEEREEEKF